jgi:hypothetical protein
MKRFLSVAALISVGSSWAVAQSNNGLYGGNTLSGGGYGTGLVRGFFVIQTCSSNRSAPCSQTASSGRGTSRTGFSKEV